MISWNYAFIYEITARYWPDLVEGARYIGESEAREKLLELYFQSVGAAQMRDLRKLFRWESAVTERAVKKLVEQGRIVGNVKREDTLTGTRKIGEWLALGELV